MDKKRKLVKDVLEEYWKEPCAVCGLETPPKIECSVEDFVLTITAKCPNCGLTISYKDHNEFNLPSAKGLISKMKMLICNAI